MKILVLAGGFGTRLQTAVAGVPKALAPVGRVPFLQLQIEHWVRQGLRGFVFLLHHQADQIVRFLEQQRTNVLRGCEVTWVIEPSPLDTGGAVAHAVRERSLRGNFLLTNADTWLGAGIGEVVSAPSPSIAVVRLSDVDRYGCVQFDADSPAKVTAFVEKGAWTGPGWCNAGLCHLDSALFESWDGHPFSLERDLFAALVRCGDLTAVPLQTDFVDIGIPEDYYRFCRWAEMGRRPSICI